MVTRADRAEAVPARPYQRLPRPDRLGRGGGAAAGSLREALRYTSHAAARTGSTVAALSQASGRSNPHQKTALSSIPAGRTTNPDGRRRISRIPPASCTRQAPMKPVKSRSTVARVAVSSSGGAAVRLAPDVIAVLSPPDVDDPASSSDAEDRGNREGAEAQRADDAVQAGEPDEPGGRASQRGAVWPGGGAAHG
jgi:hypothetical protein